MPREIELLENYLKYSKENNATDLHLCSDSRPLARINGRLTELPDTEIMRPGTINEILFSLLDENRKNRLYEKKVLDFSFSQSDGRFRANIYSQSGTYAAAIRILPYEIPPFSKLGLPASVESFAEKSKGLFLVTGATGCGKSTTLASILNLINEKHQYHILTIEDPIEYLHRHKKSLVTQREIDQDADDFASALRSSLREDPDVIMVGEMRDPETITTALIAAETGHLVLSTLHTVGAAKSIDRIIDAIPPDQQNQVRSQLASVLEGIVSQQLIPRVDRKGLVAASEVMFVNPAIRNLIREGKHYQINNIMQSGQAHGMQLLEADLARLCSNGFISRDEAVLRAGELQMLTQFLNRR